MHGEDGNLSRKGHATLSPSVMSAVPYLLERHTRHRAGDGVDWSRRRIKYFALIPSRWTATVPDRGYGTAQALAGVSQEAPASSRPWRSSSAPSAAVLPALTGAAVSSSGTKNCTSGPMHARAFTRPKSELRQALRIFGEP
jgi:hypothetical protein